MSAIFISHSSQDKELAVDIRSRLLAMGHQSVFLDFDRDDGILAGEKWEQMLYRELRACKVVIALMTDSWIRSRWCFAEISHAREKGKTIVGLKISHSAESLLLADTQFIDFSVTPKELAFDRLQLALSNVILPRDRIRWNPNRSPYPGLNAFEEEDAAVYFGRDEMVQQVCERLSALRRDPASQKRLLVLMGGSGSGKSSLARAGVVPPLKRDTRNWIVVDAFRPGARAFNELAKTLEVAFSRYHQKRDWVSLRKTLAAAVDTSNCDALIDMAEDLRMASGGREATILLVVDQLEELFAAGDESLRFFQLLRTALEAGNTPFMVLSTLRSDFLGHFQSHAVARFLVYEPFHLEPMRLEDFCEVIEGPARIAGIALEPGLVQAMVADTRSPDALPLLSFTLRELVERFGEDRRLTVNEYRDQLGGLTGALKRAAENAFRGEGISGPMERRLRQAFVRLARINEEGNFSRQRVRWRDLPTDVIPVLARFVNDRLLVSDIEDGERVIEVAHETLFQAWDRLRQWLDEDREFQLWRRRLSTRVAEWSLNQNDEGVLLRGAQLSEAERWSAGREAELNRAESDFIQQSRALHQKSEAEREESQRRLQEAYDRAEKARKTAVGRYLAGQAEVTYNQHQNQLQRSILLAIESLRREFSFEAAQVLRSGLALLPRRLSLFKHETEVDRTVFSPDGRFLAAASRDGTTRVWEVSSGAQLLKILAGKYRASEIAFSRDGYFLAVPSNGNSQDIIMYDGRNYDECLRITPQKGATCLDFSSDGKYLAAGQWEGVVQVWESVSGEEVMRKEVSQSHAVDAIAFSPDGRYLACGSRSGFTIWNTADNGEVFQHPLEGDAVFEARLMFSPDSRHLVVSGDNGAAVILKARTGQELHRLAHDVRLQVLAYSPDGTYIVTSGHTRLGDVEDRSLRLWEASSGAEVMRVAHAAEIRACDFSPDGRILATAGHDNTARLWDVPGGYEIARMNLEGCAESVNFSRDGKTLAIGCDDHSAQIWEAEGYVQARHVQHDDVVFNVTYSRDGRYFATGSRDRIARVLEAQSGREIAQLQHPAAVFAVAFAPDGRHIATRAADHSVRIWKTTTGRLISTLRHPAELSMVCFSPDGSLLATAAGNVFNGKEDPVARLWEMSTGREITQFKHDDSVVTIAFSPSGRYLATGSRDGTLRVWEVASGRELSRMRHDGDVEHLAYSPDGRFIATGTRVVSGYIWEAANGELISQSTFPTAVSDVAFSPDGNYVAMSSTDEVRLFHANTGQQAGRMVHEHATSYWIHKIAFSSDGDYLATASSDGTTRVWAVESGLEVARFPHVGNCWSVVFSPDGGSLAVASEDHYARIWPLRIEGLIDEACQRLTRNLTLDEWRRFLPEDPYEPTCPNLPSLE